MIIASFYTREILVQISLVFSLFEKEDGKCRTIFFCFSDAFFIAPYLIFILQLWQKISKTTFLSQNASDIANHTEETNIGRAAAWLPQYIRRQEIESVARVPATSNGRRFSMRWTIVSTALGQHTVFMRQYTLLTGVCNIVSVSMAQDVPNARLKVMNHLLLLETLQTDVPM